MSNRVPLTALTAIAITGIVLVLSRTDGGTAYAPPPILDSTSLPSGGERSGPAGPRLPADGAERREDALAVLESRPAFDLAEARPLAVEVVFPAGAPRDARATIVLAARSRHDDPLFDRMSELFGDWIDVDCREVAGTELVLTRIHSQDLPPIQEIARLLRPTGEPGGLPP